MVDPGASQAGINSNRAARLESLALRYREPLRRYFSRKGLSFDAAEDCVQDVFVRLARTNEETVQNAEAYLFTIASSVLITRARKARTRFVAQHHPIQDFSEDFLPAGGEAAPDRVLEGREALERLVAALSELPADTREMFLLNREEGLTYSQIAARYALSVKAVERHIGKALNLLRVRFPRHD
jgi:RNA polymerase sigma factor (sigma-70 family)